MNIVKLHKGGEVRRVRITQGENTRARKLPYLSEVLAWAKKNGWMRLRKKP